MSAKRNLFILSVIILISACRKDEKIVEDDTSKEIVDPAMYETEISMSHTFLIRDFARGGGGEYQEPPVYEGPTSKFKWDIRFKLGQAQINNNEAFYPILKSWIVKGSISDNSVQPTEIKEDWQRKQEWTSTNKFYVYIADKKQSYIYSSLNDKNPTLIMDFNLVTTENWIFDLENQTGINVREKLEIISNGKTYPALVVKYFSAKDEQLIAGGQVTLLTPLNPNPLIFGEHYKNISRPTWDIFKTGQTVEPSENWLPRRYWQDNPEVNGTTNISWEVKKLAYYFKPYPENNYIHYKE
ncbi:hypothetical protein [Crocinitomix catalasitica]|uniref:hypothetical protein n=1 Tax=Crocinitomix catalasitica TaxID=184607 RepID=UPI00048753DD|nr:hypothetical protein [Crocinitomix catalasitica]